jgi:hypothetical protein
VRRESDAEARARCWVNAHGALLTVGRRFALACAWGVHAACSRPLRVAVVCWLWRCHRTEAGGLSIVATVGTSTFEVDGAKSVRARSTRPAATHPAADRLRTKTDVTTT